MTEFKLEDGKYYVDANGYRHGPTKLVDHIDSEFPFELKSNLGCRRYRRDGRTEFDFERYRLVALHQDQGPDWTPRTVAALPPLDLRETPILRALSAKQPKPEPRRFVQWINGYPDGGIYGGYDTKADADKNCALGRVACVRVEFTEGQFDEPQPGDPV